MTPKRVSFCLWRRTWDSTVRFACRLAYCLLGSPQRLPSNQSLPNDSPNRPPTALPSRVRVRATFTKNKITPKRVSFCLWRRTWDSNPRGCYTLLDFQSSSLATRSILQVCVSARHLYYYSIFHRSLQAKFRQSGIFSFSKTAFFFIAFCGLLPQALHDIFPPRDPIPAR